MIVVTVVAVVTLVTVVTFVTIVTIVTVAIIVTEVIVVTVVTKKLFYPFFSHISFNQKNVYQKTQKTQPVMNFKISKCDETQKLKL